MKKANKNLIAFILVFVFVASGLASANAVKGVGGSVAQFFSDVAVYGVRHSFAVATKSVEKALSEGLVYHDTMMNINSLFYRASGTAVVRKDDTTVVRADNGYLGNPRAEMTDSDLEWRSENVKELSEIANNNGAEFLYVMAPSKGYALKYPSNVKDYTASNCDRFALLLREKGVPFLNLIESASAEGISEEEMFFVTDHHWRPEKGIWASEKVCRYLRDNYGFEYSESLWNPDNYNIKTYEDWFLGSQGKKVGVYFTPFGADDINLIVPGFETSLTEEQPEKGLVRSGSFEDLLYKDNINVKDHYHLNPYATYSGGDFREQIITNHANPDGKTAIVIRDSFGCAFTPFFSLGLGRLYVTDVRDGGYVGEKLDMREYIQKIKPDYVIVLYTGVSGGDSLYTFVDNK